MKISLYLTLSDLIKSVLISYILSKAPSKAVKNNGLIALLSPLLAVFRSQHCMCPDWKLLLLRLINAMLMKIPNISMSCWIRWLNLTICEAVLALNCRKWAQLPVASIPLLTRLQKLWNILPPYLKEAKSIFKFKSVLSKWPKTEYHCDCSDLCHGPLISYVKSWVAHTPGMPGTFSPPPTSKETSNYRSRHASRHVSDARAVMHIGIVNPRWRGKRSRHSRRMRNSRFFVSGKRSMLIAFRWF